jgi:hypothetical protein
MLGTLTNFGPTRTQEIQKIQLTVLSRVAYSLCPLGVLIDIIFRIRVNAFTACSALLLFQGTPSYSRNVNNFPRFLSSRFLSADPASVAHVMQETESKNLFAGRLCLARCRALKPYVSTVATISRNNTPNRFAISFNSSSNGFRCRSSLMSRIKCIRHFCCAHGTESYAA